MDRDMVRQERRVDAVEDRLGRVRSIDPSSTACFTAVTVASDGFYPTDPGVYYPVRASELSGPETEGTTPGIAALGAVVMAWHAGKTPPPLGSNVLVSGTGNGKYSFPYG